MCDSPATASANNLVTMGLLQKPTGLRDLKVYVDYYRGMTEYDPTGNPIAGKSGLMDGEAERYASLSQLHATWQKDAVLAAYRLDPSTTPTAQVSEDRPIIIRITITDNDLVRPLVFFTGRKQ
jgi:hypothetical protein